MKTKATKIYILGFMASGKTHFGKQLADFLNYKHLDLDAYLTHRVGESIPNIFYEFGETHFRTIEQMCLKDTQNVEKTVVSVGGGAPCFADSMQWMNEQGITVWLDTPLGIIEERLQREKASRPLIASLASANLHTFIQQKWIERCNFYKRAHIHIKSSNGEYDAAKVANLVELFVKN